MRLYTGADFYESWQEPDSMIAYVYGSRKDTVESLLGGPFTYMGTHHQQARAKGDSLRRAGADVLVYFTAGTSSAMLSSRLLAYPRESIAFIMMHEAVHRHVRSCTIAIPYDDEEALADLAANAGVVKFFRDKPEEAAAKQHSKLNEMIFLEINRQASLQLTERDIGRIFMLASTGTDFQKDRFLYPVNAAYFLRYSFYAANYFRLKKSAPSLAPWHWLYTYRLR
jgi:hypothetical protein